MVIAIMILVWYLMGAYGFYYWVTKDDNFTANDLILMFISGFAGVLILLALLAEYIVGENKVIFKRRK
jgi:RsiW-degrading membrane proteinase PrsW (M82 family)